MAFTDSQVRKLRSKLRERHIKSRKAGGQVLHYIEGWHAIAEANRIFGFDAWSREMVAHECVWRQQQGNRFAAAYLARVRISVAAGGNTIIREGSGAGEAIADTPGEAHERASKAAETDATKRALSTFGNPFGLSLYAGTIEKAPKARARPKPRSKPQLPASGDCVLRRHNGASRIRASALPTRKVLERIDKSALRTPEPKRLRSSDHLKFVAAQSCLVCERKPCQAHHLRYAQPRAMGRKVSDEFTVPLCSGHHRELHNCGDERKWWKMRDIDPLPIARTLWARSNGKDEAAE